MIHITYTPDDAGLAEQMQSDLAPAPIKSDQHTLIVLLSPESVQDKSVLRVVEQSLDEGHIVVPVIVHPVKASLPDTLANLKTLDLSQGYERRKLIAFVQQAQTGDDVRASNRRLFIYLAIIVLIIFAGAIYTLSAGLIAPPSAEYATENAIREGQIQTLVFPTIDAALPRTTDDALNFPQTIEAASTRNAPFLAGTASALPQNRQATQAAIATAAEATGTARAQATADAAEDS